MSAIGVVGLGKLGLPLAAILAHSGHDVAGYDIDTGIVDALTAGRTVVEETGLQALIDSAGSNLTFTNSIDEIAATAEFIFLIVPTPSDQDGLFSNKYLLSAIEAIAGGLGDRTDKPVIVVTSTVTPGACDRVLAPVLESLTGKKVGVDIGLIYNPEFVALGEVLRGMTGPDFVLIGESDPETGDRLELIQRSVVGDAVPILRMNFVNAELTKISVNTFVTMKISYANMLGEICEKLPGADVDTVTQAVGQDLRIGNRYLKGAVAYGGPCFPRDTRAFRAFADTLNCRADLAMATEDLNAHQSARLARLIGDLAGPDSRIAILGMSYKPNTPVLNASPGIALAADLLKQGMTVTVHDPAAVTEAGQVLTGKARAELDLETVLRHNDLVAIVTPWADYADIDVSLYEAHFIDCWRILTVPEGYAGKVTQLGIGLRRSSAEGARP